uniref:CW-type domain-containing protein n=1 Tax=Panagrolaimus davidi TaxID=227884 RepID=A0A914QKE6_9BILA
MSASASGGSGTCNSKQCEACRMHVLAGFSQALNASSQFNKRTGHGAFNECPYVQIKQKEKEAQKEKLSRINSQNDHTVNQMVNLLKQAQQKKKRDVSNNGINDGDDNGLSSVDQNDLKEKLLGVSTKISCDYVRGEALNSDSPWCGLCNICWTWRKLPPNYFPSYLNEVSCDKDNACLGGFGKCRSVLRTLTVLRNTAKDSTAENWEQQSINTIAACECQVEAGTPLHSFIVR